MQKRNVPAKDVDTGAVEDYVIPDKPKPLELVEITIKLTVSCYILIPF
jgi:hypothetical protein